MESEEGRFEDAARELHARVDRHGSRFQRIQFSYKMRILRESDCLSYFSQDGTAIDLGCGTGIVASLVALAFPRKRVIGIDSDRARIHSCSRLARGIPNITFVEGDIRRCTLTMSQEIVCFDVLHHLRKEDQDRLVINVGAHLEDGGRFIVLEVDKAPSSRWKYWVSLVSDYLLYPFQEKAHFRTIKEYTELFGRASLEMKTVQPLPNPLVAPILCIGRRIPREHAHCDGKRGERGNAAEPCSDVRILDID